jgi:hypothetical protein
MKSTKFFKGIEGSKGLLSKCKPLMGDCAMSCIHSTVRERAIQEDLIYQEKCILVLLISHTGGFWIETFPFEGT